MIEACEKSITKGSSVFFFPEGTRSKTGQIRPFKIGAFALAHKMKVPILAIAINGTKDALPKHSMNFHGSHYINLDVIEEIPYSAFAGLSVDETAKMVRACIAEHVH